MRFKYDTVDKLLAAGIIAAGLVVISLGQYISGRILLPAMGLTAPGYWTWFWSTFWIMGMILGISGLRSLLSKSRSLW